MGMGTLSINFSNHPVTPNSVTNAALTKNAPVASAMPKPPATAAVAKTAAPGVDHATITGFFNHSDGTSEHKPMPQPKAHIHELICAGVAPKAMAA